MKFMKQRDRREKKKSHKLLDVVIEKESERMRGRWREKEKTGREFTEPSMIAICFVIEDMLEVNDCIKASIIKTCPTIKIKINYEN